MIFEYFIIIVKYFHLGEHLSATLLPIGERRDRKR